MLKRTLMPRVTLALLCTLVFTACGAPQAITNTPSMSASGAQVTATPAPVLTDLHGPDELKAQFNKDSGVPRLILLVSPT
jgi:hypothetical protein